jgi:hypothetical protein
MDYLIKMVFMALGHLIFMFPLAYYICRKSPIETKSLAQTISAFLLTWFFQSIVVAVANQNTIVVVPAALVLSFVGIAHISLVAGNEVKGGANPEIKYGWLNFFWRFVVLYLPPSVLLGVVFGIFAGEDNATLTGSFAFIPASLYASYFSFRWVSTACTQNPNK